MATADRILAIDQGTTSSRAMLFDPAGRPTATAQQEFAQHFPADGWVEHDPEDIWRDSLAVARGSLEQGARDPASVAAIGITNQRETTVVWDRASGEAIYRAYHDLLTDNLARHHDVAGTQQIRDADVP